MQKGDAIRHRFLIALVEDSILPSILMQIAGRTGSLVKTTTTKTAL